MISSSLIFLFLFLFAMPASPGVIIDILYAAGRIP